MKAGPIAFRRAAVSPIEFGMRPQGWAKIEDLRGAGDTKEKHCILDFPGRGKNFPG